LPNDENYNPLLFRGTIMLSKDHIALSIASALLLFGAWLFQEPLLIAVGLIGVLVGSLLPDTDAPDSRIYYMKIPSLFGNAMDYLVIPVIKFVFRKKKFDYNPEHRGSLHTVFAVTVYSIAFTVFGIILLTFHNAFIFQDWNLISYLYLLMFTFGLFFGGVLHLMEDSCTKSGIFPLYPYNEWYLKGGISTGNREDDRPEDFSKALIVLAVISIAGPLVFQFNPIHVFLISIVTLIAIWMLFYSISQ